MLQLYKHGVGWGAGRQRQGLQGEMYFLHPTHLSLSPICRPALALACRPIPGRPAVLSLSFHPRQVI